MTLTLGRGPLAQPATSDLNFSLDDAPEHRLVFEDYPRRMRALVGGHAVLDSLRGKLLHETAHLPVYYAPVGDLDEQYLEPSDHTTHCPFKGDASYWHLRVGDRVIEDAIWRYPEPLEASSWLGGYCSLDAGAPDLWLQEDEAVRGHLRDPYHRVDVLETSRQVKVRFDGAVIAESDRPKLVFETGLPPRVYLQVADVRPGLLEPSDTTSFCPYKGQASYWHLRAGERRLDDAAWSYEAPLPETLKAAGHLCFDGEGIEVEVS